MTSPSPKLLLIGLATGFTAGLMGVGGGILMIPAMVLLLGFEQHRAHGTSLAVMIFLAALAAATYASQGSVNWLIAATLAPGGIVGAHFGARLARRVPALRLKVIFALFVLITGARMVWMGVSPGGAVTHQLVVGAAAAWAGLATGLVTGLVSGLLGVGGGIVMVPVMSLVLGVGQHTAQGTSLVAIIATGLSGAWTHKKLGNVDTRAAAGLAAGGLPGSFAGSKVANVLAAPTLTLVFGAFLVVMSLVLLAQARQQAARLSQERSYGP